MRKNTLSCDQSMECALLLFGYHEATDHRGPSWSNSATDNELAMDGPPWGPSCNPVQDRATDCTDS